MKIYISSDIEGTAGITEWKEAAPGNSEYEYIRSQMTKEVLATIEASVEMGAKEILVRDAHNTARNIDPTDFPESVRIMRNWSGSPFVMMDGLDESFDAVILTGYHTHGAGEGNPLSHTMDPDIDYMKLNGEMATEMHFSKLIADYFGVPVIFVSGDKELCITAKKLISGIETAAVNEGIGDSVISVSPKKALSMIKSGVRNGLENRKVKAEPMPEHLRLEVRYKDHKRAYSSSFYKGVNMLDTKTVLYETGDLMDLLVFRKFCC